MGDNKDSTGLILLGILIGVIAFALLSRRTQTLSSQSTIQQSTDQQHQHLDWRPMDIPRVDDIKPQVQQQTLPRQETLQTMAPHTTIDTSLVQMTSHLQKTASQLEQATSKLQDTISRLQQNNNIQQQQHIITQQPIQPQQPQITAQPQPTQSQENLQQVSNTVYKNNEKWSITRGQDGRIKSLEIIRDVKKNSS